MGGNASVRMNPVMRPLRVSAWERSLLYHTKLDHHVGYVHICKSAGGVRVLKALSQLAALMTYWGCGHPLVLPCVVQALRAPLLQHSSAVLWGEGPDRPLTRSSQERRERRSPLGLWWALRPE